MPIIRVDREVYEAIRDCAVDLVLDPFVWQEVSDDQEWYEFQVDDEVAAVLGDDPNAHLCRHFLIDRA